MYCLHNPNPDGPGIVLFVNLDAIENNWEGTPEKVRASQYGWNNPDGPSFLEYSFTLGDLELTAGDEIRVFAVASNRWKDDTTHATDIVPCDSSPNDNTKVTFDFDAALSYKLTAPPHP